METRYPEFIRPRLKAAPVHNRRRHFLREGLIVLIGAVLSGLVIIGAATVLYIFLSTK